MGLPAAIVGSSVIGGLGSIFGARSANRAAERNQQAAQANIGAANNAAYQELPRAFDDRMTGANYLAAGMGAGRDAWHSQMSPISGQFQYGINEVRAGDPSYGGNTQIGGHWDDLRSQNFLQSPDYQFRMKEGLDAVQNSAAAGGAGLYSGNTLRGITDFASNLASGEYGNWFNRQTGLADRDYGADVANFARDYNVFADDWGRSQDRGRYLANMGAGAIQAGAGLDYSTEAGIGQAYGDVYGASAQDRLNAGNTVSSNYMGGAGYAANQPYVSPWGGVNQAVQGGLQNYLWAQNAGLMGGGQQPGQNVFSAGPQWQQTYGGQGNYGHIFNPLFGGTP